MKIVGASAFVRGVRVKVKAVLCTAREREKFAAREDRSATYLDDWCTERELHRRGDGELLIVFIEQCGDGSAVPFGYVHRSDRDTPAAPWTRDEVYAAALAAIGQSAGGRG